MLYLETQLKSSPDPKKEIKALSVAFSAAAGAPDDDDGIDPEDLKLIVSILIRLGCLYASGPLLSACETAGFFWTGYELHEKISNMAKRVANGEAVLEPTRENLKEWLDISADVFGLSSTVVSKGFAKVLREGTPQDCAQYLAIILEGGGLGCGTASIVVEQACSEYFEKQKKMSPLRRKLEFLSTVIHFMEVQKFCKALDVISKKIPHKSFHRIYPNPTF